MNPNLSRDHKREARMVALYARGKTLQQIGAEYGISRERVRQILGRLGVQRRGKSERKKAG